jgi:hypothetical protein
MGSSPPRTARDILVRDGSFLLALRFTRGRALGQRRCSLRRVRAAVFPAGAIVSLSLSGRAPSGAPNLFFVMIGTFGPAPAEVWGRAHGQVVATAMVGLGLSSSLSALRAREAKPSAARLGPRLAKRFRRLWPRRGRGEAARPMGSSPPRAAGDNLVRVFRPRSPL